MISIDGTGLSQWDKGREAIVDVKEATHVHLANQGDSIAAICEIANGMVKIPDYLLQTGKTLIAYAVKKGEGDNLVTLGKQVFPVRNRERPEEYIYDADQRNFVYTLVQEAQEATDAANKVAQDLIAAKDRGDFNGPPGEPGAPGSALIDDETVREDAAWSSKNIIDRMCPSFEKSGTLVQCEPVDGYPLTITNDGIIAGTLDITVCGKNLYDAKTYPLKKDLYINMNTGTCNQPSSTSEYKYAATATDVNKPLYIPVGHLVGKVITLNNTALGTSPGMAFYDSSKQRIAGGKGNAITVPNGAAFMSFTINAAIEKNIQIEIGNAETGYEPYAEKKVIVADPGDLPIEVVPIKGINTVFAYEDNGGASYYAAAVTVTGKADPVAIIEKLTSAVLSLGGNI